MATYPCILVLDEVYTKLHIRFDRGEKNVFTGRKDGTNRKVIRKEDGKIYSCEDGREIRPLSLMNSIDSEVKSLMATKYGQFSLKHNIHKQKWLYNNNNILTGIICINCKKLLASKEFNDIIS